MRVIVAVRDNSFNRKYVSELFKEHELICCLFLETDRFTLAGKIRKITKRIHKYGVLRVVDELAFHVFSKFILRRGTEKKLFNTKPDYFTNKINLNYPTFEVDDIHSERWLNFIKEKEPDIIFSNCCNVIFKLNLYSIPKFGTYVLHEGITPEYKGLHSTIWALLNDEREKIGYTLLKINEIIDGGEIVNQGIYKLKENEGLRTWSWIAHNSLIEGLPNIKEAFKMLEKNKVFTPDTTLRRKSRYYSWMKLSTFLFKNVTKKLIFMNLKIN